VLSSLPYLRAEKAVVVQNGVRRRLPIQMWLHRREFQQAILIILGIAAFLAVYFWPPLPEVVDPQGEHFALTKTGQITLGLFFLATFWWVFEVVPIGVTSIIVGVIQVLFALRNPATALGDFFHPAVWFIFAALIISKSFIKSGLIQRLAYSMLALMGERTRAIYLGCGALIAVLTLFITHTAIAAALYPLLVAIFSLYQKDGQPTRFGKGLFIGMAFTAAAGSVASMLGAARGVIAAGFYREMTGLDIGLAKFSFYLLPLSWIMVILVWLLISLLYSPEKQTIPGLKDRARDLVKRLGPISRPEWLTISITGGVFLLLYLYPFVSSLKHLDITGIILLATPLFFLFKVLNLQDLEEIPWNMILFFGGTVSLGFCLWQTGASRWLAVLCLPFVQQISWPVFIICLGGLVLVLANVIVNLIVLALVMPVALVMASYLGIAPEMIFYSAVAAAGMPFMLLIGAAPNAIAYESRQFSKGEFFRTGFVMSVILIIVLGLFIRYFWPTMGLSVSPIHP
jgi:sodium-dependent dicarboxylate transporter 2/3/5